MVLRPGPHALGISVHGRMLWVSVSFTSIMKAKSIDIVYGCSQTYQPRNQKRNWDYSDMKYSSKLDKRIPLIVSFCNQSQFTLILLFSPQITLQQYQVYQSLIIGTMYTQFKKKCGPLLYGCSLLWTILIPLTIFIIAWIWLT